MPGLDWDPEAIKEATEMDVVLGENDPVDLAKSRLRDNAPSAASSIVYLALSAEAESVRLRAAQYLLDTVLDKEFSAAKTEVDENGNVKLDPNAKPLDFLLHSTTKFKGEVN